MNKKKSRIISITFGVLIVILISILFLNDNSSENSSEIEAFAKCITEKGAVMYGAFWCPHCQDTKKYFGESFKYINYVECDPRGENEQSLLCIEKEVNNYPTWEFNNDSSNRILGANFQKISEQTECEVPIV